MNGFATRTAMGYEHGKKMCCASLLFLLGVSTASGTVHVAESPLADVLTEALSEELGRWRVAPTSLGADLRCRLERRGRALELEIAHGDDPPLLRPIPIVDDEMQPALRLAVLLILESLRSAPTDEVLSDLTPPIPETNLRGEGRALPFTPRAVAFPFPSQSRRTARSPTAGASVVGTTTVAQSVGGPWHLRLSLGMTSNAWYRPFTPRLGPHAGLHVHYRRWRVELEAQLPGLMCCGANSDVQVDARAWAINSRVTKVLVMSRRAILSGGLDAGLRGLDGAAWSRAQGVEASRETIELTHGLLGLLGRLEVRLADSFSVEISGGASLVLGRRRVGLPRPSKDPLERTRWAFDVGPINPWFALSTVARVF